MYKTAKTTLINLISKQTPGDTSALVKCLDIWDKCKHRWASAHRKSFVNILRSSLAESSQSSMTAAGEKGLSLADALIADLTDSAKLDSKWEKRILGEKKLGTGPPGSMLIEREEDRQIQRIRGPG